MKYLVGLISQIVFTLLLLQFNMDRFLLGILSCNAYWFASEIYQELRK